MTEFAAFRARTYACLMEDGSEHKKRQRNKKVCIRTRNCV